MFAAIVGILFILYVITAVINVIGVVIGAVFSGIAAVLAGVFSGSEIVIGAAIGLALYFRLKKRKTAGEG